MAGPTSVKSLDNSKTFEKKEEINKDEELLDIKSCFWDLPSWDSSVREQAALRLISSLTSGKVREDEVVPMLNYTIERLVRGLSSSNKAARLGFYVALVQTLRVSSENLNLQSVVDLIKGEYDTTLENQKGSKSISAAFAYGAVIRSGIINKEPELLINVFEELTKLGSQAEVLQEMCSTFVVDMFEKVEKHFFKKHMWQHLEHHFKGGWETCTSEILWKMIVLTRFHSDAVNKKFLTKYWGTNRLLSLEMHEKIIHILFKSSSSRLRSHPVYKELLNELFTMGDFGKFWKAVIETVEVDQAKEKLHSVLLLMKEALQFVNSKSDVEDLLLPFIMSIFIKNLANSQLVLYNAASDLANALVRKIASLTDGHLQFYILRHLLHKPGTLLFDRITRTRTIASIISSLTSEAQKLLTEFLKDVFGGLSSSNEDDSSHQDSESIREASLLHLSLLLNSGNVHSMENQTDILQFLALNAYFKNTSDSSIKNPANLAFNLHALSKKYFNKAIYGISKRVSCHRISSVQNMCTIFYSLLSYIQSLQNSSTYTFLVQWTTDVNEAFSNVVKITKKLFSKTQGNHDVKKAQAFFILYFHVCLQLLGNSKEAIKILKDLEVCYVKAFKKSSTKDDSNKLEWIQVIVDILLSTVSEDDETMSVLVTNSFALFVTFLTPAALNQILDIINPNTDSDELLAIKDDSENSSDDSSLSDMDNEDDNSDVNEALKSSVKAALGDAAASSDSEDEVYMNDDAMMRVDDRLAEVFRTMSKRRIPNLSNEDEAIYHFSNRCVEFLNIIVDVRPSIVFLMNSLKVLVDAFDSGMKDKNKLSFVSRCKACLHNIINVKKFQQEPIDSTLNFEEVLTYVINKFQSVVDHSVAYLLCEVCVFVMKCAFHYEQSGSGIVNNSETTKKHDGVVNSSVDKCLEIFKTSLENFFENKVSRIPWELFSMFISKFSNCGWQFTDMLLKFAFMDDDMRLFKKCQAISLMNDMISRERNIQQTIDLELWKKFSDAGLQGIGKELTALITCMKNNLLNEILTFTYHLANISLAMGVRHKSTATIIDNLEKLSINASKGSKKRIISIKQLVEKLDTASQKRNDSSDSRPQKKKIKTK